ncbi:MAG TPA: signal peptidase I [Planctomycetes bacterium]|nr:signal peptidase I [Planctomycetota bacterium]
MPISRSRRALWWVIIGVAALLVLKTFVVDIYPVSSSSMEPTLHRGEWVVVAHGGGQPERGEVVVVRHGDDVLVKRVCGVGGQGGERLTVDPSGDIWVNGERPGKGRWRVGSETNTTIYPRVEIFDLDQQDPAEAFEGLGEESPGWHRGPNGELVAGSPAGEEHSSVLQYQRILRDGYRDLEGRVHDGEVSVSDLAVDLHLQVLGHPSSLIVALTEQGDRFELRLETVDPDGGARMSLVRVTPEAEIQLGGPSSISLGGSGRETLIHLSNVDNRVEALVRTEGDSVWNTLAHDYDRNSYQPGDEERRGTSLGARMRLTATGHVVVRALSLARDVQFRPRGKLGPGGVQVGPGEIFVLGDNSADSRDSRDFGSLPEKAIVGRPLFAIWPPKAMRSLR